MNSSTSQPHDLSPVAVRAVAPSEPHVFAVEVDQPVVADSGLVGVAAQVGQYLTCVGKWRLAVNHPVPGLQRCPEALECPVLVGFVGAPQLHFAIAVGAGKGVMVLAAEDLRQRGGGEQEPPRRREPALSVRAQCAIGDDAVDMHILSQVLPPGVQHHGDSEFAAQPPRIASELQQGPRGGVEQQPVDQPRVASGGLEQPGGVAMAQAHRRCAEGHLPGGECRRRSGGPGGF